MNPSDIRLELLRQHDEIREAIAETRDAADGGTSSLSDLRDKTLRLAERLRRHNRQEEELLQGLLRTVDAWGPLRVQIMNEQHAAEHQQILGALLSAAIALEVAPFLAIVLPAIDRVLEHMAYEENFILSEDILRDDPVVIDQCGG
jgi:hypothetical protein